MSGGSLAAWASLGTGLLILHISIFTLTISHWSLPYVRLALMPLAILLFRDFGFGVYEGPTPASLSAIATIALYGMMRVLEHSVVTLWYPNVPHWVMRAKSADGPRENVPLPRTFGTRCVYALDLLTTMRGISWFDNLEWSWVSRSLPPRPQSSRRDFLLSKLKTFLIQYLVLDICDILILSHPWDSGTSHPLTSLPVFHQIVFSIAVITEILLAMTLPYAVVSSICVICGSSPAVWPPMFVSPFLAKSLKEFWSRRWHFMFRRVFDRLSLPPLRIMLWLSGGKIQEHGRVANVLRTFLTFVYSMLLHLIIQHRVASLENNRQGRKDKPPFLDKSFIIFFLLQPLGLIVESIVVEPLTDWMFPVPEVCPAQVAQTKVGAKHDMDVKQSVKSTSTISRVDRIRPQGRWQKDAITRLYVWMFLVWTGRWWSDAWARGGYLDPRMKAVPVSPLRGLWEGRWVL